MKSNEPSSEELSKGESQEELGTCKDIDFTYKDYHIYLSIYDEETIMNVYKDKEVKLAYGGSNQDVMNLLLSMLTSQP